MNVVGRFGSLLTQGVYSVATPFHPFGGAVDIVVVQQHDGTFKSTPWYVRFGKFQGVLKGAEKIVQIEVNGVEAKFNMHLDNSGEAYFLREIDPTKNGIEGFIKDTDSVEGRKEDNDGSCTNIDSSQESGNFKQDSTDFNCDEVEVRDERVTLGMDRFDRVDSDCGRIYYELPDEKSFEGSPEYSEYVDSSSTYTNLDSAKYALESQDSISEVILVSVDGHILTAPLSTSSSGRRDFELNTEQFDSDVGEGTEQYNRDEDALIGDYLNALEVAIENICRGNSETVSSEHHLKPSVSDSEHIYHRQDTQVSDNQEKEPCADSNNEVFGSCLELQKLAEQSPINDQENVDSSPSTLEIAEGSKESSYFSSPTEREHEHGDEILRDSDELPPNDSGIPVRATSPQVDAATHDRNNSDMDLGSSDNWPVQCVSNDEELPQVEEEPTAKIMHSTREALVSDEKSENEHVEPENVYLLQDFNPDIFTRLEISLCGHLLHAGMGLSAAQEAFDANRITMDEFKLSAKSILKNENLIVRIQGQYVPWKKAEHVVLGMAACDLNISIEPQDVIPVDRESQKKGDNPLPSRGWSLWSIPFRRVRTPEKGHSNTLTGEVLVDPNFALERLESIQTPTARAFTDSPRKQIIRSNVPSTDEIGSLNLKEGQNMVNFVFSTRVLGSQKVEAHIYLWKWNTRIVISDVDGTITKSDVLGQFMPLVGKDWTHSGIARLFSAIKENGYQLLFLSARAIVQSYLTKSFLFNLKQDGKSLPVGPVVISPDGLFPSLYREVIRRAPHEFKIACLEDIKALFPPDHNPFYAGFGNRDTDELSYRKIGIPKGKIFIINPKGEVAINHRIDVKSYTSLHTLVHDMFPPTTLLEQEDYNSWNYWKMPLPDIDNL